MVLERPSLDTNIATTTDCLLGSTMPSAEQAMPAVLLDIDVSASPDRAEIIGQTTTDYLDATQGNRPFAGLVVRNAVTAEELAAEFKLGHDDTPQAITAAEQAMLDWWHKSPLDDSLDLEMYLTLPHTRDRIRGHYDLGFHKGIPTRGLLTASVSYRGLVRYGLGVRNLNPFNPDDYDAIKRLNATGSPTVTPAYTDVGPGDLVVFSTIPPTFHEVTKIGSETRLTRIWFSRFVKHEAVG